GPAGVFGGAVISTAFDDSPDGNPTTYFGARRTLTIDLGGTWTNAVRLDFLNDREWTFLSEVSFTAAAANLGWRGDGVASNATAGSSHILMARKSPAGTPQRRQPGTRLPLPAVV